MSLLCAPEKPASLRIRCSTRTKCVLLRNFARTRASSPLRSLGLAKSLIEAQPFDPARFKNFRERLQQLIQSRIDGQQTTQIEPRTPAKVIDVMDALKRSLAQTKSVAEIAERSGNRTVRKPVSAERSRRRTSE
jgi:non-homologous end joining protein Ku